MNLPHNQCPEPLPEGFMNSSTSMYNDTDRSIVHGEELWMRRMREVRTYVNKNLNQRAKLWLKKYDDFVSFAFIASNSKNCHIYLPQIFVKSVF